MKTENNANTAAIALAFTSNEETSALNATVAWTVHIIADVCGWNGTPRKGGKAVAIKAAREEYGYRVDANGKAILDAKGNRAKRSAVFNRLALVDKLIGYALATEKAWVETLHKAATDPETDQATRESNVAQEIEGFAARLATVAKGETIDALKFFLETGKAKADAKPVDNAAQALGDTPSGDASAAPSAAPKAKANFDPVAMVEGLDLEQCRALSDALADRMAKIQDTMAKEQAKLAKAS
mgnify:CR=1 FL=1|tara:strand:- start:2853 stop:3575 length:723 start_codon:yes stop_codon:yes gene_type:complete